MLHDFRSEIKLFLVVAAASAVLAVAGILLLQAGLGPSSPTPAPVAQTPSPAPSPQPQMPDTDGWQTYRNDEYGFEAKYPRDFKPAHRDSYLTVLVSDEQILAEKQCNEAQRELIEEGESFGPSSCLFGVFISQKSQDALMRLYSFEVKKPYKPLGNVGAIELYREYEKPSLAIAIPAKSGEDTFILIEAYATYDELNSLEQILSTFRFIE